VRVEINHETCLLSGKCTFFHPELFAEREDGHPVLKIETPGPEHRAAINDAIESCPTASITLVDDAPTGAAPAGS